MNRKLIIGLLVIAVAIGIIVSTAGDASSYVTFDKAEEYRKKGIDEKVHVVGELKKDKNGKIVGMHYAPTKNPNYFSFILVDRNKEARKVVYHKPKPQDFEKSDKVVVIGKAGEDVFRASKILMKCPSKYKEKRIKKNNE